MQTAKEGTAATQSVGMGQIALLTPPGSANAVLGSCVALVLHDERTKLAAVAHVVLPASNCRPGTPGKFADTAVAWMLDELMKKGADKRYIVAKLVGGANMFASNGPFQIGQQNAEALRKHLQDAKVRIAAENIGGTQGRRITFDPSSGRLNVEVAGQSVLCL